MGHLLQFAIIFIIRLFLNEFSLILYFHNLSFSINKNQEPELTYV